MRALSLQTLPIREWLIPSPSMNRSGWVPITGLVYMGVIAWLGGFRGDHMIYGLLPVLDLYNERTRAFFRAFVPFILTGIVFDSMRYYYWAGVDGHVHVREPYFLDKRLFGIGGLTPNEFLAERPLVLADLLCGFAYLSFVGEYLAAGFYLYFASRVEQLRVFAWSFFLVNILGFITYFVYPAAPPWYVREFGLGPARMDVQPSAAFAHRFDQLLGTNFFDQMYAKGIDVYGAYPSLHVAYPLLTAWVVFSEPALKKFRIPAGTFYLLMCFSAVYLQHHYVMDVLLGSAYAVCALLCVKRVLVVKKALP